MGLIIVNVVTYFLTSNSGLVIREDVALNFGESMANFHWYQMFTSMFLHGGLLHLLGNMWFLYLFGFAVEGRMRTFKYLLLYVASGLIGGFSHLLIVGSMEPKVPAIGASGAIMGVMGAAIYMFPFSPVDVAWTFWYRFGSSEWKLWWVGMYYIGINILEATLTSIAKVSGGVANLAHLGGVASGFLIPWMLRIKRDDENTSDAKSTLYMTNDVTLLSERELKDMYAHHPGRNDIVVAWVTKSCFGNGPTRPEAIQVFRNHFNGIVTQQPIHVLCQTVNVILMTDPLALTPSEIGRVASRAEKEGQYPDALQYYRRIVNDTRSTQSDIEGSAFRAAMLLESAFQDYPQAKEWYEFVKHNYPMSPIMNQVKARLQFLATKGF